MHILIAGGTGFIGSYLKAGFEKSGDKVSIISRGKNNISWQKEALIDALEQADVLINLAGKNINCRHNSQNKISILNSRIDTTLLLGEAIRNCKNPPDIWINASASAIYKPNEHQASTESTSDFGTGFLSGVVRQWEKVFFDFKLSQTRQVTVRTSVVLGRYSGAFPTLLNLTRFGLGGKTGNGRQIFSWIHIEDYFRIITFLIRNSDISGPVNCTSPAPVSNAELMKRMRFRTGMFLGLPAPVFAVKIAAKLIGSASELVLDSSYLYPEVLMNAGFSFKFPTIDAAIDDLLKN